MAVSGLATVLLVAVSATALGWLGLPPWLLLSVAVGATLLAVVATRGWLFLLLLGLALAAWAALLTGTLVGAAPALTLRPGSARILVEPQRTACGLKGCWAEARLLACTPLDPDSCAPHGLLIALASEQELPLGARVSLLARLTPRPEFRNPVLATRWPDTRPPLRAQTLRGAVPRVEDASWLARAILALRVAIRARLDATLAAPHAGIARALLLGEASAVSNELNDAIRNAGVSHVLAVSGMHVTVLVGGLAALVRLLWLFTPLALHIEARRAAALAGTCLAPLVASLCGGSPSAVRAALTSTLMFLLTALGYRPRILPVSAFAVGVHMALAPRDALHPGFVLSVAATASLLTASSVDGNEIWKALVESLRAWVSTAPFLVLCFGGTSIVALVANVVLLPLGGLLIPVAVAHLLAAFAGLSSWLGTQGALEAASGAFVGASRWCADMDPGIHLPAPTPLELTAASLLAALWLLVSSWRIRLWGSLPLCLCLALSEWLAHGRLALSAVQVFFVDVGQGDATLMQTGDGKSLLIDAGGSVQGGPDPGRESVLLLIGALRIAKLDVVVMSHPHPDHYGGLEAVLESVPVAELWDTGQAEAESTRGAQRIVELARQRGVRIVRPAELCGRARALGNVALRVLAPCPGFDDGFGPNDNSFVIRMQHGARSFLLTGDVEQAAEAQLLAQQGAHLRADVLKVAHHGSRTSSTTALLSAVEPWLAVISAGRANAFGHPHAEVEERLRKSARHVLRVDRVGGVRVSSDGAELEVSAWDAAVALKTHGPGGSPATVAIPP
jgi:competence protein ComEC